MARTRKKSRTSRSFKKRLAIGAGALGLLSGGARLAYGSKMIRGIKSAKTQAKLMAKVRKRAAIETGTGALGGAIWGSAYHGLKNRKSNK